MNFPSIQRLWAFTFLCRYNDKHPVIDFFMDTPSNQKSMMPSNLLKCFLFVNRGLYCITDQIFAYFEQVCFLHMSASW